MALNTSGFNYEKRIEVKSLGRPQQSLICTNALVLMKFRITGRPYCIFSSLCSNIPVRVRSPT